MTDRGKDDALVLDSQKQRVLVEGLETLLQYKVWRVLTMLIDAAPQTVARAALIEKIWNDNHVTGEKALNQALWTIRAALKDSAKAPRYILTIPREGYRWIGPAPQSYNAAKKRGSWFAPLLRNVKRPVLAAVAFTTLSIFAGVDFYRQNVPAAQSSAFPLAQPLKGPLPATIDPHAYFQGRDIVVKFDDKVLIIKPTGRKKFGKPLFSEDGWRVAFHVDEPQGCKLVMVHLATLERYDFGACSSFEETYMRRRQFI